MSTQRVNPEELFDRAVAAVRDESIDPQMVDAARERVVRRVAAELSPPAQASTESASTGTALDHRIRGCEGFRSLIPAYLAGALAEPRRLLFEDHTRECVPCRRALADARRGAKATASWQTSRPRARRSAGARYAIAAGLAGLVATGAVLLSGRLGLYGPDASARVRAIEGDLQALEGSAVRSIAAGDVLARGNTVRTGSDSGAVLELADGSRIELAQRSQLTLARRSDGVVLDLERGALIVEAAERKRGHLYVRTDDCVVSVVGTIFSVNNGVRGSRVSVVNGEVHVDRSGFERAVLRPGQQLATTALLGRVPIAREIAWSRNAAQYREQIAALAALGREIDATLATGGRTSTALLDRAPAGTTVWVGLPNVADELSEAWGLVEQRVGENPLLAEWWNGITQDGTTEHVSDALEQLRELGSHLGEEIAVSLAVDGDNDPGDPLIMAEVVDASGFDELLDAMIARINAEAGGQHLRRIVDPSQAAAAGDDDDVLYLWHSPDGLLAASTSPARLAELALGAGGFAGSGLHQRLADVYRDGTGWLAGVDLAQILAVAGESPSEAPDEAFDALGLGDAQHLLLENESINGANETRATLAFAGERRGAAAWLASPAPSGALEFVSSGASFAVAGLSKDPVEMFDDLLAIARIAHAEEGDGFGGGENPLDELTNLERDLGFSLRDDLAAALGGDAAFAIDGPLLPTPSWKVVLEVTDPEHFEYVLGRAVEAGNRKAAEEGHAGVRLGQEEAGGRRFLTISNSSTTLATMTFVDGYLVAAPSRALILEAIAHRDAGTTLAGSQAFRELLPSDAETDFSALLWQNLGGVAGSLSEIAGSALGEAERQQIEELTKDMGPMLVLAYGDADAVRFVARGGSGPFGFSFEHLLSLTGVIFGRSPADETDSRPGVTAAL
jgi:ferric-dicitrate binding protein FerR (iron transport regulator)